MIAAGQIVMKAKGGAAVGSVRRLQGNYAVVGWKHPGQRDTQTTVKVTGLVEATPELIEARRAQNAKAAHL